LINGLKQGRLLVHARGMVGEISDDMKYIYPCFDKTMMQFYKDTYDEIAASKSEYYGEEIEPEYPELIFASDSFSWSGGERNGVFFIESDGFLCLRFLILHVRRLVLLPRLPPRCPL
jgi:hypothetical protein